MSNKNNSLGDFIKSLETQAESYLDEKKVTIVRLDGNSFSKFTRDHDFKKPFDPQFQAAMLNAVKHLFAYCGDLKLAYAQSDEITLAIYNPNPESNPFLAFRVQKICSILASVCSNGFNESILKDRGVFLAAAFDARVFSINLEDAAKPFIWRQKDCYKNFISMLAHWTLINEKGYSAKKASSILDPLSTVDRRAMIEADLNISVENYDSSYRSGVLAYKEEVQVPLTDLPVEIQKYNQGKTHVTRNQFVFNKNMPWLSDDASIIETKLIS